MKKDRGVLAILCGLLFVSYAYFYQAGGWNQNSRFALVRAILERHTLQIDAYQLHTGDRAIVDGHYYSDKAPGTSLAALAPAALARVTARAVGVDPLGFPGIAWTSYLATVLTAGLFAVFAAAAVFSLTRRWGYSQGAAIFAATAFGIGGPMWCYATLFMGHAIAAGCLCGALALLSEAGLKGPPYMKAGRLRWRAAVIGLALGWAVVTEFQAAVPAAGIAILVLIRAARDRGLRPSVAPLIIGGAVCGAILLAYNTAAFGHPFHVGYQSEEQFEEMRRGFFGIAAPQWWRIRELLIGAYRGLLPLWPLAALAPVGLVMAAAEPRQRSAAIASLLIAVYYLLLNASYHYWEGGWAYGPRQVMTAMPFIALGLGPLWDVRAKWFRGVLVVAFAWGVGMTVVAESTTPQPPAEIKAPVRELLWPAFRAGDLSLNTQTFVHFVPPGSPRPEPHVPRAAWNLGELAGLHGWASLAPLGILWAAGVLALWSIRER